MASGKWTAPSLASAAAMQDVEKIMKENEQEFFRKLNGSYSVVSDHDGITIGKLHASERGNTSVDVFKGTATVPASQDEVFKAMFNYETRLTWDQATLDPMSDDTIHNFGKASDGNDIVVSYTRSKSAAAGLISPRDFVDLCHTGHLEDGAMSRIGAGVVFDMCPEEKGIVRGVNFPCGTVVKPVDGEENVCSIDFLIHGKIGGWLPVSLLNKQFASVNREILTKLIDYVGRR